MNNKRLRVVSETERTNANGTPVIQTQGEVIETCARHADALAAQAEQGSHAVAALIETLTRGDLLTAQRDAFRLRGTLRVLTNSLGELHTVLDELGNGRFGGAS